MPDFQLVADFQPTGDQPVAIERLTEGVLSGQKHQVLLGATGTGKTFTAAQVIAKANRPTLVLAHNKTLAAQLYSEFREFFPENAVEYFVSYYDYYQPEAYLPRSDTYIEKDSNRNVELDPLTGELIAERNELNVYPASHYVTPRDKLNKAIVAIQEEMEQRVGELEAEGRPLEAARLQQRTMFDLEMLRELGFCSGVENYSRHLAGREAGSRPWTLLDYFPPDWLLVVDESHMTIPQVVGMYKNDRTRKEILVEFGFRLPSALDNRPLTFEEFERSVNQAIFMSATPGPYELERSERVVEQLIRPTGIVDPEISLRPTEGQIADLLEEIRGRGDRGNRAIVTTLTKKMAEDLADYLRELGVKVQYLHSEVDTLERVQILRDLRLG